LITVLRQGVQSSHQSPGMILYTL